MIINSKAAIDRRQIDDRIARGSGNIELHLLDELQTGIPLMDAARRQGVLDDIAAGRYSVNVIHAPLTGTYEFFIEYPDNYAAARSIFEFAQEVSEIQGRSVTICAHVKNGPSELKEMGILGHFLSSCRLWLDSFPGTQLTFENISLLRFGHDYFRTTSSLYVKDGRLCFSSAALAEMVGHKRCGVCVDIGHCMIAAKQVSMLRDYISQSGYVTEISGALNGDVFPAAAGRSGLVKLVHLRRIEGHGFMSLRGLPFDCNDAEQEARLSRILQFINEYAEGATVTVEINEPDVFHAEGYSNTVAALNSFSGIYRFEL